MFVVTKIDEYICRNGIKIQYWTNGKGFDIVVMQNGFVKSTTYTEDQQQAREIYQDCCKQFD